MSAFHDGIVLMFPINFPPSSAHLSYEKSSETRGGLKKETASREVTLDHGSYIHYQIIVSLEFSSNFSPWKGLKDMRDVHVGCPYHNEQ